MKTLQAATSKVSKPQPTVHKFTDMFVLVFVKTGKVFEDAGVFDNADGSGETAAKTAANVLNEYGKKTGATDTLRVVSLGHALYLAGRAGHLTSV